MGAFIAVLVGGAGIVGGVLVLWRPHSRPAVIALILGLLLALLPAARRPVAAARQHRSVAPPVYGAGPRRGTAGSADARPAPRRPARVTAAVVDRRAEPEIVPHHPAVVPAALRPAPIDPRADTDIVLRRPFSIASHVYAATNIDSAAGKAIANGKALDGQGLITGKVKVPEGNVRSGPGTTNKIIGIVNQGDELIFIGRSADWYLVRLSSNVSARSHITGEQGWVSSILIHTLEQQPPLVASAIRTLQWHASDPDLIYQRNGVIHFQINEEHAVRRISEHLDAPAGAGPVKELTFMATLAWSQGHAPGGVILHALLGDGRDLGMRIGPGEGFPWVDFTLDGQELTSRGGGFPLYTATPIRLAWDGEEVVLFVADKPRIELAATSPVQSVRFALETEEGCIFHLKVADIRMTYAE